jgi:hypothetical protein
MMGIFILDIFGKLNNLSLLNSDPAIRYYSGTKPPTTLTVVAAAIRANF